LRTHRPDLTVVTTLRCEEDGSTLRPLRSRGALWAGRTRWTNVAVFSALRFEERRDALCACGTEQPLDALNTLWPLRTKVTVLTVFADEEDGRPHRTAITCDTLRARRTRRTDVTGLAIFGSEEDRGTSRTHITRDTLETRWTLRTFITFGAFDAHGTWQTGCDVDGVELSSERVEDELDRHG
jgi:hypothetical protein